MRNAMDEKAREELEALHKRAEHARIQARQSLNEGVYEHAGKLFQRNADEATALVLLAIEARLAMATSFLLWAMEVDDATD